MKATVDESCIACGLCVSVCPEVFEMGDDDLAHVKLDPIPAEHQEATKEAAEGCPTDSIHPS